MGFSEDVFKGLTSSPKYLMSKYFYDEEGDHLFNEIMNLEEYYLTNCEFEILSAHKSELLELFNHTINGFQLIEFGAGDGYKTKILLNSFLKEKAKFKYIPIDISQNVLDILRDDLAKNLPELQVETLNEEYFKALKKLNLAGNSRKIVLFLGANIGNFNASQTSDFLTKLSYNLHEKDLLMIGFDLKKDPKIIQSAYDDPLGITRDFNLNLLSRINRELGGHFDITKFIHHPVYDPISGEMQSFLLSAEEQEVCIDALNAKIHFYAWEPIHTEMSKKYDLKEIEDLAVATGFKPKRHFFDARNYFVDSVWEVV